jgi:hypothetical protein
MADMPTTDGLASRTPRRLRLAIFAALAVVAIGAAATITARRDPWRNRPRGRVFIETPLNLTGDPELNSVVANLTRQYQKLAANVAHPISDDSVKAIERLVRALPGAEGPQERLSRANAQIAVMTLVNIQHDSLRVFLALQRVADDTSGPFFRGLIPPGNGRGLQAVKVLQSWPISLTMAPISERNDAVAATALALSRALRSMQSCDVRDHLSPTLPPWCWRKENESDVVQGFARATRGVRTASR